MSSVTRGSSADVSWRRPRLNVAVMSGLLRDADRAGIRGVARRVGLLLVSNAGAGGAGGVICQEEVLPQWEARVIGRHVDAPQVAIALERDPEHVVGLAFLPLGALPEERDRGHARVVP